MARVLSLDDIYEEIRDDDRWDHLRGPGIVMVPGRGETDRPIAMLVGEAPGATENTRRRVFCGPSGRILDQLMALAGLGAEDWQSEVFRTYGVANAFITNVVKYRPPGNRTPTADEIRWGAEVLRKEWVAVGKPRILVAVGSTARAALNPYKANIAPGTWEWLPDGKTALWVQYHPAWGLRQGDRGRRIMEQQWEGMGRWIQENVRS